MSTYQRLRLVLAMKGFLLVADSASTHPDGTFSLLRGGIDRIQVPRTQPIHFRGAVIVRVTGELSEAGEHDFKLRFINEDGETIAPDTDGQVRVPDGGGSALAVLNFALTLPDVGRYSFALLVDRQQLAVWEVQASRKGKAGGKS